MDKSWQIVLATLLGAALLVGGVLFGTRPTPPPPPVNVFIDRDGRQVDPVKPNYDRPFIPNPNYQQPLPDRRPNGASEPVGHAGKTEK
jgi:hypothetical protein